MPLFWMEHEAMIAGLHFNAEGLKWSWGWQDIPVNVATKVPMIWRLLEYWPVLQLNYSDAASQSRYVTRTPLVQAVFRLLSQSISSPERARDRPWTKDSFVRSISGKLRAFRSFPQEGLG